MSAKNDEFEPSPEIEAELNKYFAKRVEPIYPDPMLPPWQVIPELRPFSMGWRMGGGEQYLIDLKEWFFSLSLEKQGAYFEKFPEPQDWEGF